MDLLTVRPGRLDDVLADRLLWHEHAQSVPGHGHCAAPKIPIFRELEHAGRLVVAVVEGGGQVLGYAIAGLVPDLHTDQVRAWCSSIFISPGYRRGNAARRLMATLEHECMARGATRVMWPAPVGSPLAKMLGRKGSRYSAHETVYTRSLADG